MRFINLDTFLGLGTHRQSNVTYVQVSILVQRKTATLVSPCRKMLPISQGVMCYTSVRDDHRLSSMHDSGPRPNEMPSPNLPVVWKQETWSVSRAMDHGAHAVGSSNPHSRPLLSLSRYHLHTARVTIIIPLITTFPTSVRWPSPLSPATATSTRDLLSQAV